MAGEGSLGTRTASTIAWRRGVSPEACRRWLLEWLFLGSANLPLFECLSHLEHLCVRIADIEAVDKLRRFGNLVPRRVEVDHVLSLPLHRTQRSPSRARRIAVGGRAVQIRGGSAILTLDRRLRRLCRIHTCPGGTP